MKWQVATLCKMLLASVLALASGVGTNDLAQATPPLVVFDSPSLVAARDVTTPEFGILNPGEKLLEVSFEVSTLITRGSEVDVEEIIVTVLSPERRGRVIDFAPRTELVHDVIGPIHTSTSAEQHTAFKLSAGSAGPLAAAVTSGLEAQRAQNHKTDEQFERLPPRTTFVASGTIGQGYGVFFKLRRWSQVSIEGTHPFRVVFAVPQSWRGDWVTISAQAKGVDRNLFGSSAVDAGQKTFAMGLYLEADPEARMTVGRLVQMRPIASHAAHSSSALPKFSELFVGKSSSAEIARQDHEQALNDSLRAVRKLAGKTLR